MLRQGRAADAIALLEPAVSKPPADIRALTLLGMALSAANRAAEANQRFQAALAVKPDYMPALRGLAMNEMSMGRVRDAKLHFEAVVKLAPQEPVARLALGEIYFNEKAWRKSAEHYEQSGAMLGRDPANQGKYMTACFEAGMLLAKNGEYGAAAGYFEKAWKDHADPYLAGYNLALAQLKAGNGAAAVEVCEQLITRGFRKAELYNLAAQAYEKGNRTKEAYGSLRTAIELDPADEVNYLDLIALCLNHNNIDLAIEIAGVGLKRLPGSDRLHLQRGVAAAMKARFDDAQQSFEHAAKLAPNKGLPQVALGLVMLQNDRPAEAVGVLRRRAKAVKDDYLTLWFLGEALNRGGIEPGSPEALEATAALKRSIQLNSTLVPPRILLAKLLGRAGDLPGAAAQLERALKLEPDNVSATYQLAQVMSKQGQAARAKELFAKVRKAKEDEREQFTTKGLAQIVREGSQ